MERRILGKTGLRVSVLGFGGAEIGFESAAEGDVARLIGTALDAGLNVIDTAECYWDGTEDGSSESLIGRAAGHRRDDFHLFTKVGHTPGIDGDDWDPAAMAASIDRSLRRLRTDRVDLLQLHSCSEALLRDGAVIEVLRRAREAGKTRFVGYSGDGAAARYAVECGAFDTLQTSVNVADQQCWDLTLPLCAERGIGVIAKRPLANVAFLFDAPRSDYSRPYWERLRALGYPILAGPDPVGAALRFTLAAPGVATAIVGTANPERWLANARLLDAGPMPAADVAAIRTRWREVAREDWIGQV